MSDKRLLGFFQYVVRTNPSKEIISFADFKGKTIKHGDTCFPPIFVTLKFLTLKDG